MGGAVLLTPDGWRLASEGFAPGLNTFTRVKALPLLLCFALAAQLLPAQSPFAIGARWNYRVLGFASPPRVNTYEAVRDTVVRGLSCLVVDRGGETVSCNTPRGTEAILCTDSSRYYRYETQTDSLHLLQDFSAFPGDTLLLPIYVEDAPDGPVYTTDTMLILSSDSAAFNQSPIRRQTVELRPRSIDPPDIEVVEPRADVVIEGIGSTSSLFGLRLSAIGGLCDGDYVDTLNCFVLPGVDSLLAEFMTCGRVSSIFPSPTPLARALAHPNPARDVVTLTGWPAEVDPVSARIYDAAGRLVGEVDLAPAAGQASLDLSTAPRGLLRIDLVLRGGRARASALVVRR